MKRQRRHESSDLLVCALRLLLSRRAAFLQRADLRPLLQTSRCCRAAVLHWLEGAFAADVSLGREELPVKASASCRLLLALFLSFAYETECRCPVPRERHVLPPDVVSRDPLVERVIAGRLVNVTLRYRADDARGWGVVATERIPRDAFVGEYTGALVSTREMQRRFRQRRDAKNYVLVLREVARTENGSTFSAVRTIVDATACGNFTRLLNHSCEPNLVLTAVRVDSLIPRLVLFAERDIESGEELTFDYAGDSTGPITAELPPSSPSESQDAVHARVACLCGSVRCRGYLPSDPSIV